MKSKNYSIFEDSEESVEEYFENNINIFQLGDTIEYITFNQEGYKKYKVILFNNKKILKMLSFTYI